MDMIFKDFLTIYEFCECLNIHYNTARNMIKSGRISAIKIGIGGSTSKLRIPTSEIYRIAEIDLKNIVDQLVEKRIKEKSEEHKILFLDKIQKTESCWNWKAAKSKSGYGVYRTINNRYIRAHRASFQFFKGDIPNDKIVCHICDNRLCVNPDHLYLGTPKENMHDMINKGRNRQCKGEQSGTCKLTDNQVSEIIELRNRKIPAKEIAIKYNISYSYVYELAYQKHRKI